MLWTRTAVTAVQLDITSWQLLQEILEDLEDIAELEQAQQEQESTTPWETVVAARSL
jgi:hypothetical protein